MRPRLLMNFALRCVRFYAGVNSRAELVTLAGVYARTALCAVGSEIKLNSLSAKSSQVNERLKTIHKAVRVEIYIKLKPIEWKIKTYFIYYRT